LGAGQGRSTGQAFPGAMRGREKSPPPPRWGGGRGRGKTDPPPDLPLPARSTSPASGGGEPKQRACFRSPSSATRAAPGPTRRVRDPGSEGATTVRFEHRAITGTAAVTAAPAAALILGLLLLIRPLGPAGRAPLGPPGP